MFPGMESETPGAKRAAREGQSPEAAASMRDAQPPATVESPADAPPVDEPVHEEAAAEDASLADKNVWVVDANSLIFQVFHALPEMTSPRGEPVLGVSGVAQGACRGVHLSARPRARPEAGRECQRPEDYRRAASLGLLHAKGLTQLQLALDQGAVLRDRLRHRPRAGASDRAEPHTSLLGHVDLRHL